MQLSFDSYTIKAILNIILILILELKIFSIQGKQYKCFKAYIEK
jgi:hypothetical protein